MQYIAPEAIEGEVVDNRSDIYSLGCTAFHLLAGRPPFEGATIAATMSAHLTKPVPSISTVNEHLPEKTDAVFERVLAKNPDDRYQSCAEFVTALQEAVGAAEVRYPASAPTLAATTSPKRGAVDPDAPTQLRKGEATTPPAQRKSRAVPILASAVGILAIAAMVLGVYVSRGGGANTSTTSTPTTSASAPPSSSLTTSLAPAPPPPITTSVVPPQTRTVVPTTVAAAPAPYVGTPCNWPQDQESADGTLVCFNSGPEPHWGEKPLPGPAVQQGTPCDAPGTRARAAGTARNVTCLPGPDMSLRWFFT